MYVFTVNVCAFVCLTLTFFFQNGHMLQTLLQVRTLVFCENTQNISLKVIVRRQSALTILVLILSWSSWFMNFCLNFNRDLYVSTQKRACIYVHICTHSHTSYWKCVGNAHPIFNQSQTLHCPKCILKCWCLS